MTVYQIPDELHGSQVEVEGEQVMHVTTRTGSQRRWNEITLYDLTGSGRWLLARAGMSVIYHAEPTTCRTRYDKPSGFPATVEALPDEAEPCPDCRPPWPEDLGDEEKIRFEYPRRSLITCDDAGAVLSELMHTAMRDKGARRDTVKLSGPAEELVTGAAAASPRFAAQLAAVRPAQRIALQDRARPAPGRCRLLASGTVRARQAEEMAAWQ